MFDASALIKRFHDSHVTLTQGQSQDMHKRRDANLDRVSTGLKEMEKPGVVETINQGGNAMRTMTQPAEGDEESCYDIDVGIVFEKDVTKTPFTTKTWVRDAIALKGQKFKTEPVVKKKCVRVVYEDGYQVDLPVLRRTSNGSTDSYEIALGEEWTASDPKAINKWFEERVQALSPDSDGTYQARRIVRFIKYFSKVHAARTGLRYPAGLAATALAIECYQPVKDRDDEAVYLTLKSLRDRWEQSPVMANGAVISCDTDRIKRLSEAAGEAVKALASLVDEESETTDEMARKAWKRVFSHSFFDGEAAVKAMDAARGIAAPAIVTRLPEDERLAMAREKATEVPQQTRPWRA